jgi:hypothetical protein
MSLLLKRFLLEEPFSVLSRKEVGINVLKVVGIFSIGSGTRLSYSAMYKNSDEVIYTLRKIGLKSWAFEAPDYHAEFEADTAEIAASIMRKLYKERIDEESEQ